MSGGWAAGVGTGLLGSINNQIAAQRNQAAQDQNLQDQEQLKAFDQASKEYDQEKRQAAQQNSQLQTEAEMLTGKEGDPNALALLYQYRSENGWDKPLDRNTLAKMQDTWKYMNAHPEELQQRSPNQTGQSTPPPNINPASLGRYGVSPDQVNQAFSSPAQQPPNSIIPPAANDPATHAIRQAVSAALPGNDNPMPSMPVPPASASAAAPSLAAPEQTAGGSPPAPTGQPDMGGAVNASALSPQTPYNPQTATAGQPSPTSAPPPSPGIPLSGPPPVPTAATESTLSGSANPPSMSAPAQIPSPAQSAQVGEPRPADAIGEPQPYDQWQKGLNVGFLHTLTPEDQAIVQKLASGEQPYPSSFVLRSTKNKDGTETPSYWSKMLSNAYRYDPSTNAQRIQARNDTAKDYSSKGASGKSIAAINTVMGHLGNLNDAVTALNGGSMQDLNRLGNLYSVKVGEDPVTNFNAIKGRVAQEMTTAYRASGGTLEEVKNAEQDINAANSPQQLHGVLKTYATLLGSKVSSLQSAYKDVMGSHDTGRVQFSDHAKQTLDTLNPGPVIGQVGNNVYHKSTIDGRVYMLPSTQEGQ